ncbi:hypothetical protein TIFTF001_000378 [Ficus carica]|uniref:Uncharacterized protein n=1 Tax=Ficus carica TaxID=3494 RepID=A0AA88CNY3_FICCA|nr:hypothetical protein TIFTF001_000378 [Ficus carica]
MGSLDVVNLALSCSAWSPTKDKYFEIREISVGCLLRSLRCLSQRFPRVRLFGCPDGLYSEWFRWVDILRVYGYFASTSRMPRALSVGGWRRSRNKDRYRASSVRWCRVVGVTCPTTVRLSAGMERSGKGSMGRPSLRELGRGWGNVTQASILDPNGGLLEVSRG